MNTNLAVATGGRIPLRAPTRARTHAVSHDIDLVVQLAHDIRSPLSGILMLAESLREGRDPVTDSQRRQLDLIYGAALSLCVSASDVVQLALDGQGLADERPDEFSVLETLRAVSNMASPLAAGKNLELLISPPAVDRRIGRSRALTRVLLNLTTNALKCTETGTVEIGAREVPGQRDRVEFFVHDTGPGMEAAVLSAIDAPRPATVDAKMASLTSAGLGLSICKKLMEQMGSKLRFETSSHTGTRFYFEVAMPAV